MLKKKSVDELGHADLEARAELRLDRVHHLLEIVTLPQSVHFYSRQVLSLLRAFRANHVKLLIKLKNLALQLLKHVIDYILRKISSLLLCYGGTLCVLQSPLECLDPPLVVLVEVLQELDLLLVLLAQAHHLIEEYSALFLGLDSVQVVLIQLLLEERAHLGQFLVTLALQGLYKGS